MPRPPIAARPVAPAARHPVYTIPPLPLDAATVDRVGVVRASFYAVAACPDVARYRLVAQGDRHALAALSHATADLARRTAVAYAASVAAFTQPEALPPL